MATTNLTEDIVLRYDWTNFPDVWAAASTSWTNADIKDFSLQVDELVDFTVARSKQASKALFVTLSLIESVNKDYLLEILRDIQLVEDLAFVTSYVLELEETFGFSDTSDWSYTKEIAETLQTIDSLKRRANATFSDLKIFSESITLDKFKDLVGASAPAGFSEFKKFLPGDYSYRFAKVKAVLNTLSDDTPVVDNLKVIVDVSDIHNKGTAVITDALNGAAVVYDRPYSVTAPDVVLSFKGGIGGVASPEISNESLTGFTVKLINSSGTYITGSVTWAADGY